MTTLIPVALYLPSDLWEEVEEQAEAQEKTPDEYVAWTLKVQLHAAKLAKELGPQLEELLRSPGGPLERDEDD